MDRNKNIERLKTETFDVCIIGGGATGCGCALDAVLRGYRVALIEKNDFASQTSSKSTKLIHGGVRYLEQAFKTLDFAQLKQVFHGLQERRILLKNAPHLARPLELIAPASGWLNGLYMRIGFWLYDLIAREPNLPKSRWLSRSETVEKIPGLHRERLHSAVSYYDGQMDDARFCLALAQSADQEGAAVANYVELKEFIYGVVREEKIIRRASVRDVLSGQDFEIKAEIFINCTGVWADQVRRVANPALAKRIRPSKGVHVTLPASVLNGAAALLIPKTSDGRMVFAIPFEGKVVAGTTDTEYVETNIEPVLENSELHFILNTLNPYLKKPIKPEEVIAGFGGLRPLISQVNGQATKRLVRDHEIEFDSVSRLVSVLGGKWTTYRLMALDAVNLLGKLTGSPAFCHTANYMVFGAEGFRRNYWQVLLVKYDFPEDVCRHLNAKYGTNAEAVASLALKEKLDQRISPPYPFIFGEVIYAVRYEMALTMRDVLARRLRLEILDWEATLVAIGSVASLMKNELNWSDSFTSQEIKIYTDQIEHFKSAAAASNNI